MARITVTDCLQQVENRFELVLMASRRARQILQKNSAPEVPHDDDKATVIALREIASGAVNAETLSRARLQDEELSMLLKKRQNSYFHSWTPPSSDLYMNDEDDDHNNTLTGESPPQQFTGFRENPDPDESP